MRNIDKTTRFIHNKSIGKNPYPELNSAVKNLCDNLIQELESIPLLSNPVSIVHNHKFKILIAKYYFFFEKNIQKALDLLQETKSKAKNFNLDHILKIVEMEINSLELEIHKYTNNNNYIIHQKVYYI